MPRPINQNESAGIVAENVLLEVFNPIYTRFMKTLLLAFVALAFPAFAQTTAPELAPYVAKHKADLALIETQKKAALDRAQHDYLAALDFADKAAGSSGNLKGVVALGKERNLVQTKPDLALSFPADLPETLRPARKIYLDAIDSANADAKKREEQIDSDYLRTLTMLESHAATNPALGQQIATEKAEIVRRATAAAATTNSPPASATSDKSETATEPALAAKLVNGNFEEVDANGLPAGWKLSGQLGKGGVLPDGVSIKAIKENGLSFVRMTFEGRFNHCGIVQEFAVPNKARTATIKIRYRGKVTARFKPEDRRCWPINDLGFYNEAGVLVGHGLTSIESEILHHPSPQLTHNQATFKSWDATISVPSGAVKARFHIGNGGCNGVFDWEHAEVTFK